MQVANRFVGAALAAVVVLAGCGGGDAETPEPEAAAFLEDAADEEQTAEMRAALAQGPEALSGCRPGRTCRLSGSIVDRMSGQITSTSCTTATTSSFARAILNATFTGSLQRAGRYNVRVDWGTYRVDFAVSSYTCQLPGGGSFPVPARTFSNVVTAGANNLVVVSDGRNLTVTGTLVNPPLSGCTGGDRYVGTVIGLSNPMVTLRGTMRCTLGPHTFTLTSTIKMVGAP